MKQTSIYQHSYESPLRTLSFIILVKWIRCTCTCAEAYTQSKSFFSKHFNSRLTSSANNVGCVCHTIVCLTEIAWNLFSLFLIPFLLFLSLMLLICLLMLLCSRHTSIYSLVKLLARSLTPSAYFEWISYKSKGKYMDSVSKYICMEYEERHAMVFGIFIL